jgi:Fe-S cluster biogenesis protein NfuA
MFGIRKAVKSAVKSVLGLDENPTQQKHWEAPDLSQVQSTPAPSGSALSEQPLPTTHAEAEAVDLSIPTTEAEDSPTEGGLELTVENVEEVIDEYIRPGVAADGGDIQLIKIEDNDVYVRLTGACQSCSSAIMTMKMGVEALLREEFPSMRELIDETEYAQ